MNTVIIPFFDNINLHEVDIWLKESNIEYTVDLVWDAAQDRSFPSGIQYTFSSSEEATYFKLKWC